MPWQFRIETNSRLTVNLSVWTKDRFDELFTNKRRLDKLIHFLLPLPARAGSGESLWATVAPLELFTKPFAWRILAI